MKRILALALVVVCAAAVLVWWKQRVSRGNRVGTLIAEARDLREYQNNPSEALLKLKEALRLEPDSPAALAETGRCLLDLERPSEAVEVLERAFQRASHSEQARVSYFLGHAYRLRYKASGSIKDYRQARFTLERACQEPSLEASALFHLGVLALDAERHRDLSNADLPEARARFSELLQRFPDSEHCEPARRFLGLIEQVEAQRSRSG